MSGESQSCLRFTLEESVWFQRGQEVGELLSISLDPDITIQENDQYVTIKGSLMLTGEYQCEPFQGEADSSSSGAVRTIQSVTESENGSLEFFHRFPVDISIPKNRIASIYDIDIKVDSFDYDFPGEGSLKLSAELAITGLYGDQQHGSSIILDAAEAQPEAFKSDEEYQQIDLEPLYRGTEEIFQEHPPYAPLAFEPELSWPEEKDEDLAEALFSAEAKREPKESSPVLSKEILFSAEAEHQLKEQEEHESVLSRGEKPGSPILSVQPAGMMEENEDMAAVESPEDNMQADHMHADHKQADHMHESIEDEIPVAEENPSSPSSEEQPKVKSGKKGLSIAEFLARKDETSVTKIKVCIVQQEDTLQEIAERYDVSVQQLLHVNRLGVEQDVEEGQVLYVPAIEQPNGGA